MVFLEAYLNPVIGNQNFYLHVITAFSQQTGQTVEKDVLFLTNSQ